MPATLLESCDSLYECRLGSAQFYPRPGQITYEHHRLSTSCLSLAYFTEEILPHTIQPQVSSSALWYACRCAVGDIVKISHRVQFIASMTLCFLPAALLSILRAAASSGSATIIQRLIDTQHTFAPTDFLGRLPTYYAIVKGHKSVVDKLGAYEARIWSLPFSASRKEDNPIKYVTQCESDTRRRLTTTRSRQFSRFAIVDVIQMSSSCVTTAITKKRRIQYDQLRLCTHF